MLKVYLQQLNERERLMLLVAVPIVIVLLGYAIIWRPMGQQVDVLSQRVEKQRAVLIEMQASSQQVKQILRQGSAVRSGSGQSLLALVDRTVRQSGLVKALKRVEPDGAQKVKVRLEKAGFDTTVNWLESLKNQYGIRVENISIDAQESSGIVNVRLTLAGGSV